jgi:hypothetical protein
VVMCFQLAARASKHKVAERPTEAEPGSSAGATPTWSMGVLVAMEGA